MDVIGSTANAVGRTITIAAHRRQVGVHARTDRRVEPGAAVFGAEDDVKDDLAKGLRHIVGFPNRVNLMKQAVGLQ